MTETQTQDPQPVKRGGPDWQNDPARKQAAVAKAAATRAANKKKKEQQAAQKEARKQARAQDKPAQKPAASDTARIMVDMAMALENAEAQITEQGQTLESAKGAVEDAQEALSAAVAERDRLSAGLKAMEGGTVT